MKTDIILSGVGGQGILSIATIIGEAATRMGLALKQAEVHGMSQRGGRCAVEPPSLGQTYCVRSYPFRNSRYDSFA